MSVALCLGKTSALFFSRVGGEVTLLDELSLGQTQSAFLDIHTSTGRRTRRVAEMAGLDTFDLSDMQLYISTDYEETEIVECPPYGVLSGFFAKRSLMQKLLLDYPDAALSTVKADSSSWFAVITEVTLPEQYKNWIDQLQSTAVGISSVSTYSQLAASWLCHQFGADTQLLVSIDQCQDLLQLRIVCAIAGEVVYSSVRRTSLGEESSIINECVEHLNAEGIIHSSIHMVLLTSDSIELCSSIDDISSISSLDHLVVNYQLKNNIPSEWRQLFYMLEGLEPSHTQFEIKPIELLKDKYLYKKKKWQSCCNSLRQRVLQGRLLKQMMLVNSVTLVIGFSVVLLTLAQTFSHQNNRENKNQTIESLRASIEKNSSDSHQIFHQPRILSASVEILDALDVLPQVRQEEISRWVRAAYELHPNLVPEETHWMVHGDDKQAVDISQFEQSSHRKISGNSSFPRRLVVSLKGYARAKFPIAVQQQYLDSFTSHLEAMDSIDELVRLRTPADNLGTGEYSHTPLDANAQRGHYHLLLKLTDSDQWFKQN